jgi:hypothetical protein
LDEDEELRELYRKYCMAEDEEFRELYRKYCALMSLPSPTEERIDEVCIIWMDIAKMEKVPLLEYVQTQIAEAELAIKINTEAKTWKERRARFEKESGVPPAEELGTLDAAMDDLKWLETKTGCKIEEIHRLFSEDEHLMQQCYENPNDEELENALETSMKELESVIAHAYVKLYISWVMES